MIVPTLSSEIELKNQEIVSLRDQVKSLQKAAVAWTLAAAAEPEREQHGDFGCPFPRGWQYLVQPRPG